MRKLDLLVTGVSSFTQVSAGAVFGWTATALPAMKASHPHLLHDADTVSWIVSVCMLSGVVGSPVAGLVADRLGRRTVLLLAGPLLAASSLCLALAPSIPIILCARVLQGFLCFSSLPVSTLLVSESVEASSRGRCECWLRFSLVSGNLIVFCVAGVAGWRWQAALGAVLPLGLLGLAGLPESPAWLRGRRDPLPASPHKASLRPFLLSLAVLATVQLCGAFPVLNYVGLMFTEVGLNSWSVVLVGLVELVFVALASVTIDSRGRKFTLLMSLSVMTASTLCLSLFFQLSVCSPMLLLFLNLLLIAGFSMGYSIVPIVLLLELLPLYRRSFFSTLSVSLSTLLLFVVLKTYNPLVDSFGQACPFWIYFSMNVLSFIPIYFLPETKGKTLDDIERYFKGRSLIKEEIELNPG